MRLAVQLYIFTFEINPPPMIDSRRLFAVRLFDFEEFLFFFNVSLFVLALRSQTIVHQIHKIVYSRKYTCRIEYRKIGLLTLTGVYNSFDELFECFSNPFCGISMVSAVLLNVHLNDFGGGNESTSQRIRTASFRATP